MTEANLILAGIVVVLTIAGLACKLAAYVIGRIIARRQGAAAPLYQDPQRAESDAWANAYPEPNREDHS